MELSAVVITVSYTHLDVYKRQILSNPVEFKSKCFHFPAFIIHVGLERIFESIAFIKLCGRIVDFLFVLTEIGIQHSS